MALTACYSVPEMRDHHGTWNEDGSISFRGKTYRKLSNRGNLYPEINYTESVRITDSDVPVLLSGKSGSLFHLCINENFLSGYAENGIVVIYCEESIYNDTVARIEAGIPMLNYYIEDCVRDDETGTERTRRILLDDDTTAVLHNTLAQDPLTSPIGTISDHSNRRKIFSCSEDTYFSNSDCSLTFMYFDTKNEGCIRVDNFADGTTTYYPVAEEDLPLLLERLLYN